MTALGNVPLPSGRHVAWRDWDVSPRARCMEPQDSCPFCAPNEYAKYSAKHRADVAA